MDKRLKKITGFVRSSIKNAKNGFDKINPLNKPVNKEDVSDTGIETIKLGNRGIKTVEKSVKTAYRTVRTTENTVRKTGTTIYRTAQITVKSTIAVSKFAVNAVVHTVAFLTSPLVIFLSAIIVIIIMVATLVVILLGGAADSNQQAYSSAAGLGNVVEEYQNGIECLQNAIDDYRVILKHRQKFRSESLHKFRIPLTNRSEETPEKTANEDGMIIPVQEEIAENSEQITVSIDRSHSAVPREDLQIKGEIVDGSAQITLPEFDKNDFFTHVSGYTWGFSTNPDGKKIEYYGGVTYSFSEDTKLYRVLVKYGGGNCKQTKI